MSSKSPLADEQWVTGTDGAGSAKLGMLNQAEIPRFPAQGHAPEPSTASPVPAPGLGVQRKSCAGLEELPWPFTCRENKICSNLHHWESTGR